MHLILAVVLLQTIGLFHQKVEQRSHSNIYHGMLVMVSDLPVSIIINVNTTHNETQMIRQSGLIAKVAEWVPPIIDRERGGELDWRQWAFHEMTKRYEDQRRYLRPGS